MTQAGIEPATTRFLAQRGNHCATAVPNCILLIENIVVLWLYV